MLLQGLRDLTNVNTVHLILKNLKLPDTCTPIAGKRHSAEIDTRGDMSDNKG